MVDHFSLFGLGSVAAAGAGGSSAGGGGCFIATAAYGTPLAKEVKYLSEFRDRYMLTNGLGTSMVRAYWKVGPKIARYIEKRRGKGSCERHLAAIRLDRKTVRGTELKLNKKMKILIIGSSGFIGNYLCDRLSYYGHKVIGLDNKAPVKKNILSEFILGDILNAERSGENR